MSHSIRFAKHGSPLLTNDVAEAMSESELDWEVEKLKIQSVADHYAMPEHCGIFRVDTHKNLGVVGKDYGVVQNIEAAGVLQDVINKCSEPVTIRHGADVFGGDRIFLACNYGEEVMIGTENFTRYLVCSWAHNGGVALKFSYLLIRRRTGKILRLNIAGVPSEVSIRHTKYASERLKQATNVIHRAWHYFDKSTEQMDILSAARMFDGDFSNILSEIFPSNPDPDKKRANTIAMNSRNEVLSIYQAGEGSCNIRGTRLGGFLAVAEWSEKKTTRIREGKKKYGEDQVKLNGTLFGQRDNKVQTAFDKLLRGLV